jgi:DNA (cytosine-5)-methyltransferase 1
VDDRPEVYLRHSKQAKATHRGLDEPAGTVAFGNDMASAAWVRERPATTIACDPRVQPPGHKVNAEDLAAGRTHYDGRAGKNAIRLSEVEAAVLQSFPAAYPWRGTRTKQFEQIGNAVPPMMAYKLLESLCVSLVRRRVKPVRKRRRVVHG